MRTNDDVEIESIVQAIIAEGGGTWDDLFYPPMQMAVIGLAIKRYKEVP